MIRAAFNFLAGLVGGKVQLVLLVAGTGFLFWYLGHIRTVAYEQGATSQRDVMLKEQAKAIEEKTAELEATFAQERSTLQGRVNALTAERNAIVGERRAISETIQRGFSAIGQKDNTLETEIRTLPASSLDSRIREALSRARTADATQAGIRAH